MLRIDMMHPKQRVTLGARDLDATRVTGGEASREVVC
jgi:hypothetical protein